MWARRAAWWIGRVLRALVALPSLLVVAFFLYSAAVYTWYFISQGGPGAVPLVMLAIVSLVAVGIACLPVVSWIRRLFTKRQPAGSAPSAEPKADAMPLDERVVLVDVLWAVAPLMWLVLPLAIGASVITANYRSLGALLLDPASRGQMLLFGTLFVTYATMWISWARSIALRSRGRLSPPSLGIRLFDPNVPVGRRRSALLLTAILLISTVLSLLQFTWYIAAPLLLW